jgi:hypothetical protein
MKAKKLLLGAGLCVLAAAAVAGSAFAEVTSPCPKEEGLKWFTLKEVDADDFEAPTYTVTLDDNTTETKNYIKCGDVTLNDSKGDTTYRVYGKTSKDCTQANAIAAAKKCAEENDLKGNIALIINSIIGIIGIVAVVMIIMGGITYATSQGDPAKVKKGKDTILYGVIGVVVSLLAFAIVNFVLDALINGS